MNVMTSTPTFDDARFHTEFRELYRTLVRKNDKIALKKMFSDDERFQSVDEDTLRVISVVTDRPSLWNNRKNAKTEMGGYSMCKAMDEIEADARAEGVSQGKDIQKNEVIIDMLRRGKTVEQIVEFCNFPYEQVQKIASSMN